MDIFEAEEKQVSKHFLSEFKDEIQLFNQLLEVYTSFVQATSGKIKDNDFPNWTILILLSQTLPLMSNAASLLISGYLRSSEIMIRVVSEAAILSVYFKEFPEAEEEYRTVNYRVFFHNHRIEEMLNRVENEGKIFITDKISAKKLKWNQVVFINLFKESSNFLHNNPDLIYQISRDNSNIESFQRTLIIGPQLYSKQILALALGRAFNAVLFSIVTLGVSLNIIPNAKEKAIIDKSSELTNALSRYK